MYNAIVECHFFCIRTQFADAVTFFTYTGLTLCSFNTLSRVFAIKLVVFYLLLEIQSCLTIGYEIDTKLCT